MSLQCLEAVAVLQKFPFEHRCIFVYSHYMMCAFVSSTHLHVHNRLYATFMMVGCVKEELQAMKEGLTDIIPSELLAGLTAEVS